MKTCQSTKQSTQAKKKLWGEEKVQDERTQEVLAKLMKKWFISPDESIKSVWTTKANHKGRYTTHPHYTTRFFFPSYQLTTYKKVGN